MTWDPETLADSINAAIREGISPLREQPPIGLSRWADESFYLSPESSGTAGWWETRPYQRAIMDCISLDDIEVLSLQKCGRVGYTKMIVAAMGYFAAHRRRNQVVWQPTDGDASDFVKDEVDPMLRDVAVVRDLLKSAPDKKSSHNTIEKKSFIGSVLDVKGGKSSKNYRRMTKDVAFYDELDGFDPDIDHQGNSTSLGDKRLTQSPYPKSIRGSTPTLKGSSQIEQSISHADMRFHRHVPCPKCGEHQELSWSKMQFDDHNPVTTRHVCEFCSYPAGYSEYADMDGLGVWRAVEHNQTDGTWKQSGYWIDESGEDIVLRDSSGEVAEFPRHVGFWIWGGYSYDLSWPAMVGEFIDANEAKKVGAIEQLKTFVNMRLGETWEEEGETADEHALYMRREHYNAEVPNGVQYLTAYADVQDDRIEYEVCGWGSGEESWSIDYVRLYGDMSKQQIWDVLGSRLRKRYSKANGDVLDIRLVGIDSGGHYTDEVYKFARKQGIRWVIPTKGSSQRNQPIASFPRKPNQKNKVYLTLIGTDTAKELIYCRYLVADPGPGYCHYPVSEDYDEVYFQQATAEKKVKRYTHGVAYYVWDAGKRRNEALDCRVGNLAMIRILQSRFGVKLRDGDVMTLPQPIPARPPPKRQPSRFVRRSI